MNEKTIYEELKEMQKRVLKPKTQRDEFFQMCERETLKQQKKV